MCNFLTMIFICGDGKIITTSGGREEDEEGGKEGRYMKIMTRRIKQKGRLIHKNVGGSKGHGRRYACEKRGGMIICEKR